MRLDSRAGPAATLALALLAPLATSAAEPAASQVAQLPLSRPDRNSGPRAPTGPEGESVRPGDNTSGDQTLQDTPAPTSPAPRIGLFPEFGARLLNQGIDFHGIAFDHFLANPSAGVNIGHTANLGAFRPAVDVDLGRLGLIPGGTVRLGLTFFGLRSDIPQIITQAGGVFTGFQTTPATQTNLLSLATYEQRLLGNRLSIEVGRTNVYNYFFLPNSVDPFTHYSSTVQVGGDFPSTPYPVWGGRATYKLTPTWYLQAGAFEDNYRTATNYGSRVFATNQSSGAQILAEVGQRSEFSNDAYPSNLELGLEFNTRTGRSNLKGTGAPAIPLLQRPNYPGGYVAYFQGLKTIYRGPGRDVGPPQNIAVYGSFDVAADSPQPIDFDAMLGANFTGFVPGRPFDVLGVQAKYQQLSKAEGDAETLRQRIVAGPGPRQRRNEFAFEIAANIQLTPAIAFRPNVQYFINPDNYYPPSARPGRPKDGFEAGFFAVVSLGRLLGTSLKPF